MLSCSKPNEIIELERLGIIKGLVANGCMDYSKKVRDFIADGRYGTNDLRSCVLTANDIHKIETDELEVAVDGNKYVIFGRDTFGNPFYACGKIVLGADSRRLYFFVTAHERS